MPFALEDEMHKSTARKNPGQVGSPRVQVAVSHVGGRDESPDAGPRDDAEIIKRRSP